MEALHYTIDIPAEPKSVWEVITNPDLMVQWMAGEDFLLRIQTNWQPNGRILLSGHVFGFQHKSFQNIGRVLIFDEPYHLCYTHLSSLSKLPDVPENHTRVDYRLEKLPNGTRLTVTLSNFPTYEIYKHLAFYWRTTVHILRDFCTNGNKRNDGLAE